MTTAIAKRGLTRTNYDPGLIKENCLIGKLAFLESPIWITRPVEINKKEIVLEWQYYANSYKEAVAKIEMGYKVKW